MGTMPKYQVIPLIVALLVFGGGFSLWLQARFYQPQTPEPVPYRQVGAAANEPVNQSAPYQSLQSGCLFFGEPAQAVGVETVFQSKLVLWGITGGKNSRAVVGLDPKSNAQTEIVKSGDLVGGERVIRIGKDFIVVRNQTGEGKVRLGESPKYN